MLDRNVLIQKLLARNVENVIEKKHLEQALVGKKKLRVKHGIDPTGDKIHIGRAVVLWKLKEFQDLGHKIVLIIGDFTAQIGDPSDKLEKRPFLTEAQVKKNLKNYLPQIGKILDLKKCEVRYNSEWLSKLSFREISELAETFTVQQMVERENFKVRWNEHSPIGLREFMYPLMQGYDSVAVKADVELGGTDQLFNLLAGRKIQERYGQKPQDIMTTRMLLGTDGRKMSTSWGNVINIVDSPNDQFGKVMSMHDNSIPEYLELATALDEEETEKLKSELKREVNPKTIKSRLAFEIVSRYHGEKKAHMAQENFDALFSKHTVPQNIPAFKVGKKEISVLDLVLTAGGLKSKGEARRLIEQGGVDINGEVKKNPSEMISITDGDTAKLGKKKFLKLRI